MVTNFSCSFFFRLPVYWPTGRSWTPGKAVAECWRRWTRQRRSCDRAHRGGRHRPRRRAFFARTGGSSARSLPVACRTDARRRRSGLRKLALELLPNDIYPEGRADGDAHRLEERAPAVADVGNAPQQGVRVTSLPRGSGWPLQGPEGRTGSGRASAPGGVHSGVGGLRDVDTRKMERLLGISSVHIGLEELFAELKRAERFRRGLLANEFADGRSCWSRTGADEQAFRMYRALKNLLARYGCNAPAISSRLRNLSVTACVALSMLNDERDRRREGTGRRLHDRRQGDHRDARLRGTRYNLRTRSTSSTAPRPGSLPRTRSRTDPLAPRDGALRLAAGGGGGGARRDHLPHRQRVPERRALRGAPALEPEARHLPDAVPLRPEELGGVLRRHARLPSHGRLRPPRRRPRALHVERLGLEVFVSDGEPPRDTQAPPERFSGGVCVLPPL